MKKQPEITDATRSIFMDVFCEFYRTTPMEKITVKEIAAKAGYNRATFYQYFQDTYALLTHVEDQLIAYVLAGISSNVNGTQIGPNFISVFSSLLNEHRDLAKIFLCNPYNSHFPNRLKTEALPLFLKLFQIPPDDIKAQYAFEFYVPGIISVLGRWLRNEQDLSIDELGNLIRGILEDGILAQLSSSRPTNP